MKKQRSGLLDLFLSVILAAVSLFVIGRADQWVPYSELRDTITDALRSPGGFIAGLIYPYGVHTGGGAGSQWAHLALVSNSVVYVLFWYACLRLAGYLRQRRHQYDAA